MKGNEMERRYTEWVFNSIPLHYNGPIPFWLFLFNSVSFYLIPFQSICLNWIDSIPFHSIPLYSFLCIALHSRPTYWITFIFCFILPCFVSIIFLTVLFGLIQIHLTTRSFVSCNFCYFCYFCYFRSKFWYFVIFVIFVFFDLVTISK